MTALQTLLATHPFATGFTLGLVACVAWLAVTIAIVTWFHNASENRGEVVREGVGAAHTCGDTHVG